MFHEEQWLRSLKNNVVPSAASGGHLGRIQRGSAIGRCVRNLSSRTKGNVRAMQREVIMLKHPELFPEQENAT
ncbi:hypothetical protein AAFF_G00375580 [Aldrovandia affinis]|uniref:Uncharacterized protein n=1 Tax=Aldrovandia affinis TaxID=143900 RepID=A0AAD7SGR3_9TELE|nr:hypothetical protein AAFF_G00375580 [Aldrovandia affinis]